MATRFWRIEAFEPVAVHRDCFKANLAPDWCKEGAVETNVRCPGDREINLHPIALGEKSGSVSMHTADTSSGDTTVAGEGDIPLRRLDDVLPDADDIDFIKLDCEGYELFALRGGEQLIRRCMPVICVEQKPGKAQSFGLGQTDAVEYLKGLGYKVARHMSGDYIMVPA